VISHEFTGDGPFVVRLTVTDDDGNTATASQPLNYRPPSTLDVPICGDQDDGTVVLRCAEFTRTPGVELWRVAGNGSADVTFDWVYRNAGNHNQLSAFVVDDDDGTIDGTAPGEPDYAAKAVSRARTVFVNGSDASTPDTTLAFTGGERIAFYISTTTNETLALLGDPTGSMLFSLASANADGIAYSLAFDRPGGPTQFSFEDLLGGGDGDFDDVVFTAAGLTTTNVQLALAPAGGTVAVGDQTCVTGTVTDDDGQPVGAAAVDFAVTGANPASASRVTNADGRAELCYVGAAVGTDTITGAVNGITDTATRTWTAVVPTNRPPAATPGSVSTDRDTAVAVTLAGSDPDGDGLTFAVVGQPAHGSLSGSGASLTYTPAAGYVGADAFTFAASDGTLTSAPATVSIEVKAVNRPPTVTAQSMSTDRDVPVSVTLAGSDPDGDALTFAVVGQPAHGSLAGAGASLTYTPAAGYVGADAFTFAASDGRLTSAPATVSITVKAVAEPSTHQLLVSADAAHLFGVQALDGQTFRRGAPIYAFVGPKAKVSSIKKVTFWIDDPQRTGPAFSIENEPGFDLARTATLGSAYPLESSLFSLGTHTVTAKVETKQGTVLVLTATITVADADVHSLQVSTRVDRDGAVPLNGATLKASRYVFLGAEGDAIAGLDGVVFTLDGKTVRTETDVDYDLAGTTTFGKANALDTRKLSNGSHTVVATVHLDGDGVRVVYQATFTVAN
jgi:Bacterial Ig domain/Domain of unknown function (DUF4114)